MGYLIDKVFHSKNSSAVTVINFLIWNKVSPLIEPAEIYAATS